MPLSQRLRLDGKIAFIAGGGRRHWRCGGRELHRTRCNCRVGRQGCGSADSHSWQTWVRRQRNTLELDVTTSRSVDHAIESVLERFGKLDVAVAAAGVSYEQSTIDHSDENWRRVMAVNLDGAFFCIRAASRAMIKTGGGSIIAISSICSRVRVRPELHVGKWRMPFRFSPRMQHVALLVRN